MSAVRRHKKHHQEEHENHERWLVSGYDMMTLLFAVFVVLFAISSVNVSKVHLLTQSLQESLSGPVFTGGRAMQETGSQSQGDSPSASTPPLQQISPQQALEQTMSGDDSTDSGSTMSASEAKKAAIEEDAFRALKAKLDGLVAKAHMEDKVATAVNQRGLRIRLLTDDLFFASGSATVQSQALPTLAQIGGVVAQEGEHPVEVEGHTDDHPIHSALYPSNWQLSGARAAAVVQQLTAAGVSAKRVSLAGYGAERPVAPNSSAAGRAENRRVEIVLTRQHGAGTSQGGDS